ncbi:MAG: M28 family peptidase [Pseudomonadota bacterium]
MDGLSRTMLESVLSLPTMSFHETAVSTFIRWYCAGLGLPVEEDGAGNLIVRYRGKARDDNIIFTAHMDHPGFEVISATGPQGVVALWGKVDAKVFGGSKVVVYTADGQVKGRIGKRPLSKKHLSRLTFSIKTNGTFRKGDFGTYDVPSVKFQSGMIRALACDNMVSVSVILDLMTRFAKGRAKVNVAGLFTRGEEAGFLGAFAVMESKKISKQDPLIVLECSAAKGSAVDIGGGPVVRAGDLQSTYDPAIDVWISEVASGISLKDKNFKSQRALLQGGRCEACVYVAEGYVTGGIAMPLGNYHNHGPRGYAAEYVSQEDYDNYLKLLAAIAHKPMKRTAMKEKVAPIWRHYKTLKRKLIASK